MKPKIMDMDTDWEVIKDTQLSFLTNQRLRLSSDFRYSSMEDETENQQAGTAAPEDAVDPRETLLRALVMVAGFN